MHIAFIDESGTPSPADGTTFFIVAALVVKSSRAIGQHVRRTRRALKRRERTSELKASRSDPKIIRRLLQAIDNESCDLYAMIVDKSGVQAADSEYVYRAAVSLLVLHCVRDHPHLHVYLDKRYTNRRQRMELEQTIQQTIATIPEQVVIIKQADSTAHPGLQAVDFIAWAFAQKYIRVETWAAEVISSHVRVEQVLPGKKLAALPGGR